VVTERGVCNRVDRAIYGDEAGDAAVVMLNNATGLPPYEGQITQSSDISEPHTVTIPFLGLANDTTGTIAAQLLAADGGTVTLTPTTIANTTYEQTASFSSGGPRWGDSALKPEVSAPGVSVASAGIGTGTGSLVISGTSMATPMTAGVAALVKQAHPTWNGNQIKAAIMNTADPSLDAGYNTLLDGSGAVQAQHAVASPVLAQTSDELDSLTFGVVPGSSDYHAEKRFTLTNTGSTPARYALSVAENGDPLGASVGVYPTSVVVPPGRSVDEQVSLTIPVRAFAALPSDDSFALGLGNVETIRGEIVATPAGSDLQTLHVPYLAVPRGVSNVLAAATPLHPSGKQGSTLAGELGLLNAGIHSGTADLYAWGIHEPNPATAPLIRDVGVQADPATDANGNDVPSDRQLVFLINTRTPSSNQADNYYEVDIDTNGDGTPDYYVVGDDIGAVETGQANGQMGAFTFDSSGNLIHSLYADAPMNGTTIELPTLASDLGLSGTDAAHATFSYSVFTEQYPASGGTYYDAESTGSASFNPFDPAVSSGNFATLPPRTVRSFPLTLDPGADRATPALGWLVASVDDAAGAPQAAEIPASLPHQ
jgi:minor extracellular serine protease Vpr